MKVNPTSPIRATEPERALGALPSDPPELAAAMARGLADEAAGRLVPHAKVKAWLMRLRDGHMEPPPRSGK